MKGSQLFKDPQLGLSLGILAQVLAFVHSGASQMSSVQVRGDEEDWGRP